MKMIFCYDGPIQTDGRGNHYSTVINNKMFNRYKKYASEIIVAIRVDTFSEEEAKSSTIICKDFLKIVPVCNLSTVKGILFDRKKAESILEKEMKNVDFAVIRLPSFIGLVALSVAKKLKKPFLIEMVGCPWDSLWNYGIKGKIVAPFMWYFTKKHIKNSENVIYVTNEFLQKRYPTKGKNTNCSNVEIDYTEEKILENRLKKIDSMNEIIKIGTAAAVNVPYKGHQYVIKALGELKKSGKTNYIYQMAGAGNQERLRNCAQENDVLNQIEFLGQLTRDEIYKWLDNLDLYVQPSRQEGLPRALIEAMSRGIPCFGAKTGGIPELLKEEYIFSNTNKNIDEIVDIIEHYSKEKMKEQAKINFNIAKEYQKEEIQKRRDMMFDIVLKEVIEKWS